VVDSNHDLASRRGRPVAELGALFPDARLWRWLVVASYAGLVALEAIGDQAWRVAATPYLDIALFVGLLATVWRALRPRTRHEKNAEMRAALASLRAAPVDPAVADRYGLMDESGKLIDDTPPAWADELTPEPATLNPWRLIARAALTPALALLVWVVLLIGLAAVDQARAHWPIAVAVVAAVAGAIWLLSRTRPGKGAG
jgi:hypothetical protein